jgi:hypothetical protein
MTPLEAPLTIRSLALRLHLSAMTVSRALRNAPGVSQATRQLVLEAAARRGYRPDPSLAVLNAYRRRKRHLLPHETIAYLTNFPTTHEWKSVTTFVRNFEGAKVRAAELGYSLEHFWLGAAELTGRRASQILVTRGIRGLLIGPLYRGASALDLDWNRFATVALGRSLAAPAITTVSTHHAHAVELAWQTAWSRGYRRIGLVLTEEEDARTAGTLHSAHVFQQYRHRASDVPLLVMPAPSTTVLISWVREHQPDLVIGSHQGLCEMLSDGLGSAVRQPRFLNLNATPNSDVGGIDQGHEKVGEHAMTTLHQKLIRRETGIPALRELTLIDGIWKEGRGVWRLPRRAAGPSEPLMVAV